MVKLLVLFRDTKTANNKQIESKIISKNLLRLVGNSYIFLKDILQLSGFLNFFN